jgi:predicted DNA-binding protein (MmcQ/YjbR family)
VKKKATDMVSRLKTRALAFPGTWEDHPWGDACAKVGKKIFVFFGDDKLTLKLVAAHEAAMSIRGTVPTGYGMGKAGWVTIPLDGDLPPFEILDDWVEESYRLIAPKKLAAQLNAAV